MTTAAAMSVPSRPRSDGERHERADGGGDRAGEEDHEQRADDRPGAAAAVGPGMARRERQVDRRGGQPEADPQRQQRRDDEAGAERRRQRLAAGQLGIDRRPPSAAGSIVPTVSVKAAISRKVMPATFRRWTRNAVSRGDQARPGRRSIRAGPSSTTRIQATMNITVGMTSSAFSASTTGNDSSVSAAPRDAQHQRQDPRDGDEMEEEPQGG